MPDFQGSHARFAALGGQAPGPAQREKKGSTHEERSLMTGPKSKSE
jgi:hypothetical protein